MALVRTMVKNLFRRAGFDIVRLPKQSTGNPQARPSSAPDAEELVQDKIFNDPLNAKLHLEYAILLSRLGRSYLAYAELQTAQYLGADRAEISERQLAFRANLPSNEDMSHNRYFRLKSLSSEILSIGKTDELSVLDVGGGQGELASFIPDIAYCLAEPEINGISGTKLPFPDNSFEFVVACHVLEHIPLNERWLFLDQLLLKSRRGVFLLNPFNIEGTHAMESLNLAYEIAGLRWIKEHLECGLPLVTDITAYADKRGLQLSVKPNGTYTTTLAFVFLEAFANRSKSQKDLIKINRFFNEKYIDILDSANHPNAMLVYLGKHEAAREHLV